MNSFGHELYRLRSAIALNQVTVAKRAGLARGYYSQLENSRKGPPPAKTVKRIADALGLAEDAAENLKKIAAAERCAQGHLSAAIPQEIAQVIEQLMLGATVLPTRKIQRIIAILEE